MAKSKLTHQILYEEIGRTYRYYLNWRYGSVAGFLATIYSLFSIYLQNLDLKNICLISALVITFIFWIIETRIRTLYQACTKAGKELELGEEIKANSKTAFGIYSKLEELRGDILSHSNAINFLFGITILATIFLLYASNV